jgi:hypothetical protein
MDPTDQDMDDSPNASFDLNSSRATGGSANAAMAGQVVESGQTSSLGHSPGESSESMPEQARRAYQPIQSDAAARASASAPSGANVVGVTATGRDFSDEGVSGSDRGNPILLPVNEESTVVPKPRSRSPTPKAERESASGRSSEHAQQSLQSAPKRHSGRSTPKGAERGENSRPPLSADERLAQELYKLGTASSPGSRSLCSAAEVPPGTPELFDLNTSVARAQIPVFPNMNFRFDNQGFSTGPAGTVRDLESLPNLPNQERIPASLGDPSPIVHRGQSTGPGTGGAISPVPVTGGAISSAAQDPAMAGGAYGPRSRLRTPPVHQSMIQTPGSAGSASRDPIETRWMPGSLTDSQMKIQEQWQQRSTKRALENSPPRADTPSGSDKRAILGHDPIVSSPRQPLPQQQGNWEEASYYVRNMSQYVEKMENKLVAESRVAINAFNAEMAGREDGEQFKQGLREYCHRATERLQ